MAAAVLLLLLLLLLLLFSVADVSLWLVSLLFIESQRWQLVSRLWLLWNTNSSSTGFALPPALPPSRVLAPFIAPSTVNATITLCMMT